MSLKSRNQLTWFLICPLLASWSDSLHLEGVFLCMCTVAEVPTQNSFFFWMSSFTIDQFSHLPQSVIFTQYFSTVTFSENSCELVALICGRVVQHGKCNESEFWQSRRHESHTSKLKPAAHSGLCCGDIGLPALVQRSTSLPVDGD